LLNIETITIYQSTLQGAFPINPTTGYPKLRILALGGTSFSSLPASFAFCTNLQVVYVLSLLNTQAVL
jgi:hypothetical protein